MIDTTTNHATPTPSARPEQDGAVGSAEHPRGGNEVGTAERLDSFDMLSAWVAAAAADASKRDDPANARPKLHPFDPFPDPPSGPPAFWEELKRREIFQGIAVYALIAFGVLYSMDAIIPALGLPDWTWRASIIAAAAGLPVALAIDWLYDLTPEGGATRVAHGPRRLHASARPLAAHRRRHRHRHGAGGGQLRRVSAARRRPLT